MRQTGLINVIRTTGDAGRGGSVLGALVGLVIHTVSHFL